MGKLFGYLILIVLLVVGLNVAAFIWAGAKDPPSDAFTALTTPPSGSPPNPTENGYFLLLGFTVGPKLEPGKTGFEMWQEAESMRGHLYYDYTKEGRAVLQVPPELAQTIQGWKSEDLLTQEDQREETRNDFTTRYAILLERYAQWLTMPFDDEGFGHPGSPRLTELFLTHRIYVAAGFQEGPAKGIDRLAEDLTAWRDVLANAKSLPLKIVASTAVRDDTRIVSTLLNRQLDIKAVERLSGLVRPLTRDERSLLRPVQREFAKLLSRYKTVTVPQAAMPRQQAEEVRRWVATLADMKADAFNHIVPPSPENPILRAVAAKQRTLNIYADYYDALIKSVQTTPIRIPKLHDVARNALHGTLQQLTNPINNLLISAPEPVWEPFASHLVETDALLRLVGLQILVQAAPPGQPMATIIGQAGPDYYDPFTGFPMVWNPSQKILYSVGKDGRDDGGDSTFDVSLKLESVSPIPRQAPGKPAKPGSKSGPKRAR